MKKEGLQVTLPSPGQSQPVGQGEGSSKHPLMMSFPPHLSFNPPNNAVKQALSPHLQTRKLGLLRAEGLNQVTQLCQWWNQNPSLVCGT